MDHLAGTTSTSGRSIHREFHLALVSYSPARRMLRAIGAAHRSQPSGTARLHREGPRAWSVGPAEHRGDRRGGHRAQCDACGGSACTTSLPHGVDGLHARRSRARSCIDPGRVAADVRTERKSRPVIGATAANRDSRGVHERTYSTEHDRRAVSRSPTGWSGSHFLGFGPRSAPSEEVTSTRTTSKTAGHSISKDEGPRYR